MPAPSLNFTAKAVAVDSLDDLDAFVVVLAERSDGSGERLEIQRSLAPADEQDIALGMDTYCVCLEDGACHYGGIQSCVLDASSLRIDLDPSAVETLGIASTILVELDVAPGLVAVLRQGLYDMFANDRDPPATLTL